jgi:hypothetical protein
MSIAEGEPVVGPEGQDMVKPQVAPVRNDIIPVIFCPDNGLDGKDDLVIGVFYRWAN